MEIMVLLMPIGSREPSRRNCRETLAKPLSISDLKGILPGDDVISRLKNTPFVMWGIHERGFQNKESKELFNKLNDNINAYAILYLNQCIACAGRILAAFNDDKGLISRKFWGSDKYKYVFFVERACCNIDKQCHIVDRRCGDAVERENSTYFVKPLLDVLSVRTLRKALIRELKGPEAEKFLEMLSSMGCNRGSTAEADRSPDICNVLAELLGNDTIERVQNLLELKGAALLYGPPGMGKTALAECMARRLNAELVYITGHQWLTRHTIIGGYTIEGGTVKWKDGVVLEYSKHDNRVVIVLDEINRAEPEIALAELFTALAYPRRNRRVYVPELGGKGVDIGNIYFIATANPVDAVALGRVGVALQRRFPLVELSPSKLDRERLGKAISKILGVSDNDDVVRKAVDVWIEVRNAFADNNHPDLAPGWSYALDMANLLREGFTCEEAFKSIYSWYLRTVIPDEKIDARKICGGGEGTPTRGEGG